MIAPNNAPRMTPRPSGNVDRNTASIRAYQQAQQARSDRAAQAQRDRQTAAQQRASVQAKPAPQNSVVQRSGNDRNVIAKPGSSPRPALEKPAVRTGAGNSAARDRKPNVSNNGNSGGTNGGKPDRDLVKPSREGVDQSRNRDRERDINKPLTTNKPDRPRDRDVIPSIDDKPARDKPGLNKPGADKPDGRNPTRNDINKPGDNRNRDIIDAFQPGQLKPRHNDPQTVSGLRDRDVRSGSAPVRRRVIDDGRRFDDDHPRFIDRRHVDRRVVINNRRVIIPARSCGHSFCHGHSRCVFVHTGFHHHGFHHHGFHHPHSSFFFGFASHNFGISIGSHNWWNHYSFRSRCHPSWYGFRYRPFYHRPFYSLRYNYGCYVPRHWCYRPYYRPVYYAYPAYSSYWWLYDNDYEDYQSGYSAGYAQGYDAGSDYGEYEPTWLAGGSSAGGGYAETLGYDSVRTSDGWDLLLSGDVRAAHTAFDREALELPDDGLPQIGYAITSGLLERYDEAVLAMRSALRDDPDSLREAPIDARIAEQIRVLLTHYRNITREKPGDADALFMTAALRHLLGENALAYFAVDQAIEAGDRDDSAYLLKNLIQTSLDAQPDGEGYSDEPAPLPYAPAPAAAPAPQTTAPSEPLPADPLPPATAPTAGGWQF